MKKIKLYAWYIWILAGFLHLYEFIHRVAPGVMVPEITIDFSISSSKLGIISSFYFYSYAIMQIPVGILLDKFGPKIPLSFSAVLIAIGSYMFSITDNIYIACISKILIGAGSAFPFVGCLKIASIWFSDKNFSLIVGLTNLLGVIGAVFSGKPLALYMDSFGWRYLMYVSTFIGLVLSVLLFLNTRNVKFEHNLNIKNLTADLKKRKVWLVALFGSCIVTPIVAYGELWGVSFLLEKYNILRPEAAGLVTTIFIGIGIGGPLIGAVALRFNKLLILLIGSLLSFSFFLTIIFSPNLNLFELKVLHFCFGFSSSSMLLCFSINASIATNPNKATVIAFTNMIVMAISALSQPLVGVLLDINNNFYISFLPLIFSYIVSLVLLVLINNQYSRKN